MSNPHHLDPEATRASASRGPAADKKRIFVVDDHAVLREGLSERINQSKDLVVCGEAGSAEEALERIGDLNPDLALIDLSLPRMSGLELIKVLKARHPSLRMLVLSMHDEGVYAERSIRAGARGYIMKHQVVMEVQAAIRLVLSGELYLSQKLSKQLLEAAILSDEKKTDSVTDLLSERELEVFTMIGRGMGSTEIARKLHLNVKTVETYQARMKEKLNARDSAQLSQHAQRWVQANEV